MPPLNRVSAFWLCFSFVCACIGLSHAAPATGQTLTSIDIVGPDTINSHGTLRVQYSIMAHYSDGSTAPLNGGVMQATPDSTAAITQAGAFTVTGNGFATITATYEGSSTFTATKDVLVYSGALPSEPFDLNCVDDAATGANYTLRYLTTGPLNDVIGHCGPQLIVAHKQLNRVQVIDVVAGTLLRSWQLSAAPLSLARAPGTPYLFAGLNASQGARINMQTGDVTYFPLSGQTRKVLAGEPGEIWVLHGMISRFNVETLALLGTAAGSGPFANYLPSSKLLFIADGGNGPQASILTRYTYAPATGTFSPSEAFTMGANGQDLDVSPDGNHLSSFGGFSVNAYITDQNPVNFTQSYGTFLPGSYPKAARYRSDSKKLLASNGTSLMIFDVATHTSDLSREMTQCISGNVNGVRWSPTGRNAFVSMLCGVSATSTSLVYTSFPAPVVLTVAKSGAGGGTVTSSPGGIDCGTTCWDTQITGTSVTLMAAPSPGSIFLGWSGVACNGSVNTNTTCAFTLSANLTVTANFLRDDPALADFNADGKPDILWRNTPSGALYVWRMNGPALLSDSLITTVDPGWKLDGIADFNGDGHPDIVWRNGAGDTYVWYLVNGVFQSDAFLFSLPPEWVIQGVADFNNDGKPDFLMRNVNSGNAFAWFFNNNVAIGDQFLFNIDPSWKVEGVADLNADGQPDLLFRNVNSGLAFAWNSQFSAGTLSLTTSTPPIFSIDSFWEVVQVADWNNDNKPDLLFRNRNSGVVFVWYMDGTTLTTSDYIIQIDPSWEIVPRR